MTDSLPLVALLTGAGAVVGWVWVLVRSLRTIHRHQEHRPVWLVMPITAMIAAAGSLASGIGYAIQRGVIVVDIDRDLLTLIASMGRGALLMGALVALAYYRPRH